MNDKYITMSIDFHKGDSLIELFGYKMRVSHSKDSSFVFTMVYIDYKYFFNKIDEEKSSKPVIMTDSSLDEIDINKWVNFTFPNTDSPAFHININGHKIICIFKPFKQDTNMFSKSMLIKV